jgi:predicted nucleic acid-binding protein
MSIIDTSLAIDRIAEEKAIEENITIVTAIEYPVILEYKGFTGKVIYADKNDLDLALKLQFRLRERGTMKGAADLIISAIAINKGEALLTADNDFSDISEVSNLRLL